MFNIWTWCSTICERRPDRLRCLHVQARKRAVQSIAKRAHLGIRATPPKRDKAKKVRNYDGYIQKKFLLSILKVVLLNMSEAQSEWVKKARFEQLLVFRMLTYPHRLGYRIVDVFCSRTCELQLKDVLL